MPTCSRHTRSNCRTDTPSSSAIAAIATGRVRFCSMSSNARRTRGSRTVSERGGCGWASLPERSRSNNLVYTSELTSTISRSHRFGKARFCLPELEFVNRCAYFDYQRDRIYVRSKKRSGAAKAPKASPGWRRSRPIKVNKRLDIISKRCPYCKSRRLSEG